MSNIAEFANKVSIEDDLNEVDLIIRAAWFIIEKENTVSVAMTDTIKFLADWSIRPNINASRLKTKLRNSPHVSFRADGQIHIPNKTKLALREKYSEFLIMPMPEVEDTLLEKNDFENSRKYIKALVKQINASRQFEIYDGCAVLMRRLAEVLIIDAYEANSIRDKILFDGQYMMMKSLLGELNSQQDFKLSRNAPRWLERLKELGDNAAHSRTYITKKIDIDEFKGAFRNLISELDQLSKI